MTIEQIIAGELSVRPQQAAATLELLDSGNTIPFIARYRKEVTGSLDEEQIRMISERAQYLRNLEERRQEILESITSQEKLTPELESQIKAAVKMQELEDLYLPYRPKKRTRAQIARERGLEPLAELIMAQSQPLMTLDKLAREELPDLDVSLRGAVSIARRVQDPLAELVKIEPKAIGVGQYQHDVNQKELTATLGTVVESCVNHVGVELNTASPALLSYVAGISGTVAKNIIAYRDDNGAFTSRKELLKVARLGPAAFTQCAGFLRIAQAKNPLDNTSVHPESYILAEQILAELGFDLKHCNDIAVQEAAAKADASAIAVKLNAGLPTVTDILEALARPGRDPREDAPAPLTRKKVAKLSDLEIGSVVKGTVQNVVDFGVFVDIGLKTSGLIHRSELSNSRFHHPLDVISVGDVIEPVIISIDEQRNRIGLSLKQAKKTTV